jgi:hypothetical protein
MRTLFIALMLATATFAGDTNVFRADQDTRPPLIAPSKAASITNGITLGQIVKNLGPGFIGNSSAGIIHWSFADGRELNVWPLDYTASEVLSTNRGKRAEFWFSTNAYFTSPK